MFCWLVLFYLSSLHKRWETLVFLSFFPFSFRLLLDWGVKIKKKTESCAYKSFMNDCWILNSSHFFAQQNAFGGKLFFSPLFFSFNYVVQWLSVQGKRIESEEMMAICIRMHLYKLLQSIKSRRILTMKISSSNFSFTLEREKSWEFWKSFTEWHYWRFLQRKDFCCRKIFPKYKSFLQIFFS